MIKWILQDLKRILRSHKTYILLIVIMLSMINFISINVKKEELTIMFNAIDVNGNFIEEEIPQSLENIRNINNSYDVRCLIDFDGPNNEDYCDDYNTYFKYFTRLISDISDEEYYQIIMMMLYKKSNNFLDYYDAQSEHVKNTLDTYLLNIDTINEIKKEIKHDIIPLFDDFEIPYIDTNVDLFNLDMMQLHETYTNYTNHYPRETRHSITSSFFIANYLNDYSMILLVAGVLLIFDSFYRDYKLGVTKNILSAPIKREYYFIVKTISSLIGLLIIVFVPLLICSVGICITTGYDTLNYPIYISRTTMTSMHPDRAYAGAMLETLNTSSYKDVCTLEPVTRFAVSVDYEASLNPLPCHYSIPAGSLKLLSLKTYILITLFYLLLLIVFIGSLNTMMSMIFKNQTINAIVLLSIIISGPYVTQTFIGSNLLKWLPTTFMSPTALMMQTIPYTMLNGIITISSWIVIITIINTVLIRKKDFTY